MTLFFAACFLPSRFWTQFFKIPDPKKIAGQPDELDIRVQIDWSTLTLKLYR
jgi:hypothetical protein